MEDGEAFAFQAIHMSKLALSGDNGLANKPGKTCQQQCHAMMWQLHGMKIILFPCGQTKDFTNGKNKFSAYWIFLRKNRKPKTNLSANDAGKNLDAVSIASFAIYKLVVMLLSWFMDHLESAFLMESLRNSKSCDGYRRPRQDDKTGIRRIFCILVGPA